MENTPTVNNTKNLLFVVLTVSNLNILPNTALESLCHNCGNQKQENSICCNPFFCVNYNKEGHPSTSRDCPTFSFKKIIIQNKTTAV